MRKIIALCLVLFLAVCSYAQMDTSLITKDGRTVLTTTSAPGQSVVFTNVGYLQAQSFVLGTNAAVSNWPAGGGAGTTNASGINVAATPNNYTAASPNVESHLAGINDKLGSFTTGAVSTTIIVTQDCVFVTNTTSALAFTEVNISSNGTYSSLSLSSIVPTNAIMVQVAAQAQFTNSAYLAFYDASSNFVGGMQTIAGIWFYSSFNCPLYANKSIVYWCDGLGANGSTRRISIRIVGWWIPKTTTYNLPSGGIGVITNEDFVAREGDHTAWDFTTNNLVADTTWRSLSLTNIIPSNATHAVIRANILDNNISQLLAVSADNITNSLDALCIRTMVANVANDGCFVVNIYNGKIKYFITATTDSANLQVLGYWVPKVQTIAGNAIGGTMVSGAVPVAVNSSGGIVWSTNLSSSGAGTTNASGINVAATPNNYTAALPNVESHLSGINDKLGGFTTGAVSTTISVTQDFVFVNSGLTGYKYFATNFTHDSTYRDFSFSDYVPTGAVAVQMLGVCKSTNIATLFIWCDSNTNQAMGTVIPYTYDLMACSGMVPLNTNRQAKYISTLQGSSGTTRRADWTIVGWYVPKTTTYNLPSGGIGTITNGTVYVPNPVAGNNFTASSFTHDGSYRSLAVGSVVPTGAVAFTMSGWSMSSNSGQYFQLFDYATNNLITTYSVIKNQAIPGSSIFPVTPSKMNIVYWSDLQGSNEVSRVTTYRVSGWFIPQVQAIAGNAIGGNMVSGAVPMAVNSSGGIAWSTNISSSGSSTSLSTNQYAGVANITGALTTVAFSSLDAIPYVVLTMGTNTDEVLTPVVTVATLSNFTFKVLGGGGIVSNTPYQVNWIATEPSSVGVNGLGYLPTGTNGQILVNNGTNWVAANQRLTSNLTVTVSNTMTSGQIQSLIDAVPKNLDNYQFTLNFNAGTYTLTNTLYISGFYGREQSYIYFQASSYASVAHTTQQVELAFSTAGANKGLVVQYNTIPMQITGIHFSHNNNTTGIHNLRVTDAHVTCYFNYFRGAGVANESYGINTYYNGIVYVTATYFNNVKYAMGTYIGGRLINNGSYYTANMPNFGNFADGASQIQNMSTTLCPGSIATNQAQNGGFIVTSTPGKVW